MTPALVPEPLCPGEGPFRPNVGALILDDLAVNARLLVGERSDTPGYWQWPQGGIQPGESPRAAVRREILEETGLASVEIAGQLPNSYRYRFPQSLSPRFAPFIGQEQIYFIAQISSGFEADLKRATSAEFRQLGWRPLAEIVAGAVWFKRDLYRRVSVDLATWLRGRAP